MAGETDACFSVSHLRRLAERGEWKHAVVYLCRFLPPEIDRNGLEAHVLSRFLVAQSALASILAGTREGAELAVWYSQYGRRGGPVDQGVLRLGNIMLFCVPYEAPTSDLPGLGTCEAQGVGDCQPLSLSDSRTQGPRA